MEHWTKLESSRGDILDKSLCVLLLSKGKK